MQVTWNTSIANTWARIFSRVREVLTSNQRSVCPALVACYLGSGCLARGENSQIFEGKMTRNSQTPSALGPNELAAKIDQGARVVN
jgi:hypothetical protein